MAFRSEIILFIHDTQFEQIEAPGGSRAARRLQRGGRRRSSPRHRARLETGEEEGHGQVKDVQGLCLGDLEFGDDLEA